MKLMRPEEPAFSNNALKLDLDVQDSTGLSPEDQWVSLAYTHPGEADDKATSLNSSPSSLGGNYSFGSDNAGTPGSGSNNNFDLPALLCSS